MAELQKTPLYEKHLALKADLVEYGGWLMPVQYEGIITEVRQTRRKAGLFDTSHMGEFLVEGPGAADFLQKVLTNDLSTLNDGRIIYSPICYPHGGTVDDILVYRCSAERYLLVVNAANAAKDYAWLSEKVTPQVSLRDLSAETALLAVQGPNSLALLLALTQAPLAQLRYYHFLPEVDLAGIKCLVSRTGYTGEDGFEIFCAPDKAEQLWDELLEAGQVRDLGLAPAGLGARDVLRLEASLPLYGHELSESISPLEAGLDRFVSFKKGEFIGREALLHQKEEGLSRRLGGLILLDRGVLREGYPVFDSEREIGFVSSGTYSPTLNKSIGMAFLPPGEYPPGSVVEVIIRDKALRAQVVTTPFYRRESK
ncbi:MAG: glycine cleavage system aminomethyltransferase GcvT [Dethiobacteria bacterium]|jgi:aminomethyltransferase|nr:glycine cleavage system aminomethyltransferase GcvT [Bacillota bacterium]HOL16473.1 glycine cleavage system aminomethyltransferase GcvT [Bacillota bacterium]HQE09611.1 glycine cleavage system aminomethyltransferase GcvT [Bacillota bacterium]